MVDQFQLDKDKLDSLYEDLDKLDKAIVFNVALSLLSLVLALTSIAIILLGR